jgi:GNAT superfamily N-acetyltransferase
MAVSTPITIERIKVVDLPLLLPLMLAYCEFYEVAPRDDRLVAMRIGLMNDLYVVPELRGGGVGRQLIEHCRGLCRKRGANKLTWETAPDNHTAQRLYDSTGAQSSTWMAYEIDAW